MSNVFTLRADYSLPFFREGEALGEWAQMRLSPTFKGLDIPHGDGRQGVVIVPGFLGTDAYLLDLFLWLRRIDYRPYFSQIGLNVGCLEGLRDRLLITIEKAYGETQLPVILIAHSLGMVVARAAEAKQPQMVSGVVSIGGLVSAVDEAIYVHPFPLAIANTLRLTQSLFGEKPRGCMSAICSCETIAAFTSGQNSGKEYAIFTERDGVVRPRCSVLANNKRNHRAEGTHSGLAGNYRVYIILSQILPGLALLLGFN